MKKNTKRSNKKPVDPIKKFGSFDDKTGEFIITSPQTPVPWTNHLWNNQIDIEISNHGNGLTGSRILYIFDKKEKNLWSPNWHPVCGKLASYEVRHGFKYSVFKAEKNDIEITWHVTVHYSDPAELWKLEIKNLGRKEKELLVVPYYEIAPSMWTSKNTQDITYRSHATKRADFLCLQTNEKEIFCFHTDKKPSKFEMRKSSFLKGYSSLVAPKTIINDEWENSFADDMEDPCFSAGFDIKSKKDQSTVINMEIFRTPSIQEAEKLCATYSSENAFRTSLTKHAEEKTALFNINNLKTNHLFFNRMANIWSKYQVSYNFSRNRTSEKDVQATMSDCDTFKTYHSQQVRNTLLETSMQADKEGFLPHASWFQYATCQYLRETGDFSLLEEPSSYLNSEEKGTVLEHLKRTVEFIDRQLDINDPVKLELKNETVSTTMFHLYSLDNMAQLLKILRDPDAESYIKRKKELAEAINKTYFRNDRYILSAQEPEGGFWLLAQVASLLSKTADSEKSSKIIETIRNHLSSSFGLLTHTSPENTSPPDIIQDNKHNVRDMFLYAFGLAQIGLQDESFTIINRTFATNLKNPLEKSCCEPYLLPGTFLGPTSKNHGRALESWKNDSAAWLLKIVWDCYIGLVPDFDCIKVNTQIPRDLGDKVEAKRIIRGKKIRIEVAKKGFETEDAAFTMRVKNGDEISYNDLTDNEYILITF